MPRNFRLLRLGYEADYIVHDLIQLWVFVYGICCSNAFKPFVHVAIVEGRSVALALLFACRDEEVVVTVSLVGLPCLPHALQRCAAKYTEAFAPKAPGPFDGVNRRGVYYGELAVPCVCYAILLCNGRQ